MPSLAKRPRVVAMSVMISMGTLCGSEIRAATPDYNSNGFESPKFTIGNIVGQDGFKEVQIDNSQNAVMTNTGAGQIQTGTVYSGSQAAKVTKVANSEVFIYTTTSAAPSAPAGNYLNITWRMKCDVPSSPPNSSFFGPFFGIDAYSSPGNRIVTFGLDAHTTDALYMAHDSGGVDVTGNQYTPTAWNLFSITLDYSAKKAYLYVNGASQFPNGVGFIDQTATTFWHADLAGLSGGGDAADLAAQGAAYFDDFSVASSTVPEPAMLSVVGIAVAGLSVVRIRR